MQPRNLALEMLNTLDRHSGYPEYYLERAYERDSGLTDRDRAFTTHLIQGVLRWRIRLDWIIERTARFPFRKIDPPVLNVLRLALYQIFFMDRVPDSAAVNEAVKQVKTLAAVHVVKSANGILRQICREKNVVILPDRSQNPVRHLSIRYSYPEWLVTKWVRELGQEAAEGLLAAGNRIPGMVVRTNTLRIARSELIRCLEREGISAGPTRYSPDGVVLEGIKGPITQSPSFRSGLFQVQGEAAQVCSHLLFPRPGERVLDVCSGVGGKGTHMAQMMKDRGRILAVDRSHIKLLKLADTSRRLGIRSLAPVVCDAGRGLSTAFMCAFDRIMVDGPCSALGVIARHPDAKWNRGGHDILRLSALQKQILEESLPLLRGGGRLLYATCTLSREENEEVVESVLSGHREVNLVNLQDCAAEWAQDLVDGSGFLKAFPHVHGTDGFFGALFEKRGT